MIIGIGKILIIFPFIPYLIFILTSKSLKKAHMYNGLFTLVSIVIISNYQFEVIPFLIVVVSYLIAVFIIVANKTKGKRNPKRFGKYFLYYLSIIGLVLYLVLVIIGVTIEFLN